MKREIKVFGSRCGKGMSKSLLTDLFIKHMTDKGLKVKILSYNKK